MRRLRETGVARLDAVGWHYIEVLSERTLGQTGPAQALLHEKLQHALAAFEHRLASTAAASPLAPCAARSPLAVLLQEMAPPSPEPLPQSTLTTTHRESTRVRQFRQQLRQISVQKRVSKAIAKAPQNAGPINSHMLVLRALGLMRDISPDYLNRFMTHVDTLLCLDDAYKANPLPRKNARTGKK
jgi:hypothetical protein